MPHNLALSVALGCNTDVAYIGSGVNAKAAMFYVSDYVTKGNLSFQNMLSVYTATVAKYARRQEESMVCIFLFNLLKAKLFVCQKTTDTLEDRARRTVIKCLNAMHADAEVPATLVAGYLLDIPDHYTSHSYLFIITSYFINAYRPSNTPLGTKEEDNIQYNIETGDQGLTLVNQCILLFFMVSKKEEKFLIKANILTTSFDL